MTPLPPASLARRVALRALALAGLAAAPRAAMAGNTLPPHHLSTAAWPPRWLEWLVPRAGRFTNPWPTWTGDKQPGDLWKFFLEMRRVAAPAWGALSFNPRPTLDDCSRAFPIAPPDAAALASPPADAVQATWIGHATVLVQMEGLSFITDPHFSQRCSPVQFLGPPRAVQPSLVPEDAAFPALDAVLISHNHYDHLDAGSVARLLARFGGALAWYVPLGLKAWFQGAGVTNVTELDWWGEAQHAGSEVRVVLTPAQHWSSRGPLDRRASLWGGWAVLGPSQRFWFAGDTGYCEVFSEIGSRLGPFDLAAIPIGAYEPRWFMKPMHINPQEAVQVHRDVRSARSIGVHCCTFNLTTEPLDEAPRLLEAAAAQAGLAPGKFDTLQHGATLRTAGGKDLTPPALLPLLRAKQQ